MLTCSALGPIQTRSDSSFAFSHSRYHRRERLVNLRRLARRTGKVDEMSRGLRLVASTHLVLTSGEHFLKVKLALSCLLTCTCSPRRTIQAFRRCAGKVWLHELGGEMLLGQCFGAMRIIGGLREVGTSSCGSGGNELEARFLYAMVRTLLMAAGSPTSSGSHSGCTHGICMIGSLAVAYSAQSARANRLRMMVPRSGGARESRSWHDLHAAHESSGKNRHVYGCTV